MKIKKAKEVIGKTLVFRDASEDDAEFIYSLRVDPEKSKYLSKVSQELSDQRAWLKNYENRDDQAYFIIEFERKSIGTIRLYDQKDNSFCWGSWILINSRPSHAAMESALMVYSYAFTDLGFTASHFDVRKENEKVWQFHERFGAKRESESDLDFFYSLNETAIREALDKYSRFLPNPVTVIR